ncbi:MAG: ROK family protein, partial [Blastocatellia bacterium]|nr:ROK family protein [Blastocatellia bacterium]
MNEVVLALDLGGTNSRFGAVSAEGEIVARGREKTPEGTSGQELADFLVKHLRSVQGEVAMDAKILAVAAAIPAIFDAETGLPARLPNLAQLEGVDLSKILNNAFGVRPFLENDATAATIGEHWLG